MGIAQIDARLIAFFHKAFLPAARIALFVVFFWFGFLKVIGLSPAGTMVHQLFDVTISFLPFDAFYLGFGLFECLIGILFLVPKAERVVMPLLGLHMFTTAGPLMLVPSATWSSFLVPTLEGQYIIKNLVIIALAIGVSAQLVPLGQRRA